ncbi:hypothetical protein [Nesterenkonia pannonica]|uniref:hypothetical protein n=1 Tax=Nesterenkonia pannonica TaxID=1548602 RepID=UPI002164935C|nr:hypothetical protein [Nesterenkonia pannonica]
MKKMGYGVELDTKAVLNRGADPRSHQVSAAGPYARRRGSAAGQRHQLSRAAGF